MSEGYGQWRWWSMIWQQGNGTGRWQHGEMVLQEMVAVHEMTLGDSSELEGVYETAQGGGGEKWNSVKYWGDSGMSDGDDI